MRAEPSDIPRPGDRVGERVWQDQMKREPMPGAWPGEDERKDRDGLEPEKENDDGFQR
jgi:hypothetical protein